MAAPSSLRGAHRSSSSSSSRSIGSRKWDESVPPVLRPLIRAYILGYASSVGPRIVTLVLQFISARQQQRRRRRDPASDPDAPQLLSDSPPPQESFASSLRRILVSGFDPQRFPAFCAALIGGATILEVRTTCPFPPWLLEFSSFFLFQWLRLSRRPSRTTPGLPHGNTAELTCATSAYFTDHYRGSSANYQRQQS